MTRRLGLAERGEDPLLQPHHASAAARFGRGRVSLVASFVAMALVVAAVPVAASTGRRPATAGKASPAQAKPAAAASKSASAKARENGTKAPGSARPRGDDAAVKVSRASSKSSVAKRSADATSERSRASAGSARTRAVAESTKTGKASIQADARSSRSKAGRGVERREDGVASASRSRAVTVASAEGSRSDRRRGHRRNRRTLLDPDSALASGRFDEREFGAGDTPSRDDSADDGQDVAVAGDLGEDDEDGGIVHASLGRHGSPSIARSAGESEVFEEVRRALEAPAVYDQTILARLRFLRGPSFVERHSSVQRGDRIARMLRRYDVEASQAAAWEGAAQALFDFSGLQPRRSMSLFFERDSDELSAVEYLLEDGSVLFLERGADGDIAVHRLQVPTRTEARAVSGTIDASKDIDFSEAGVPERIVAELSDVFGWEVDFDELRPGDSIRAVYEATVGEDGAILQAGSILAAEVETNGQTHTAIYHADEDGRGGYYDPQGRSLDRGQLRYPLEFTRISSEFSTSRFHPILRRDRPHMGVDFSAPTGTPVRAVADGVVRFSGWGGQMGRMVRIEHDGNGGGADEGDASDDSFDSLYAHLSRISTNAVAGGRVSRGEVIGYVGSTGLATGPHLHFALFRGDEYVDPLSFDPPPSAPSRAPTPRFQRVKQALLAALATLHSDGPVQLSRFAHPLAIELTSGFSRLD